MVAATKLQTAYQSSMQILEHVMQAQNDLQAVFSRNAIGGNGILRNIVDCNAALNDAVTHLLEAQRRLTETPWPEEDDYGIVDAAD